MIIIGIDLGVSGAISAVDQRGISTVVDLPIICEDDRKRLDARGFVKLLRELIPAGETGHIVTEDVRVRQMQGRAMSHATETTLVGIRYAVHSIADVCRVPVTFVQPQTWKRFYGLASDKSQARSIATSLYPAQADTLKRVKDHNRAESLLIAHWGIKELL